MYAQRTLSTTPSRNVARTSPVATCHNEGQPHFFLQEALKDYLES